MVKHQKISNYCETACSSENTQIRLLFIPNLGFFVFFGKMLQLDKFEGADFKYDNIVCKFQPKNSQIQAFLFFREILQIEKFEDADFKYDNSFFLILAQKNANKVFGQKYPIRHFWSQV